MSDIWQHLITYTESKSGYDYESFKHELEWCDPLVAATIKDFLQWYVDNHDNNLNDVFKDIIIYISSKFQ